MSMLMNDRVLNAVHENARAFYEGRLSSGQAYAKMDGVSNHWMNYYAGIVNETRELFDRLIESYISEDVDRHRRETYASRQLRAVRENGIKQDAEGTFRMKVSAAGNGSYGLDTETKWLTVTQAQLDALIPVFEV